METIITHGKVIGPSGVLEDGSVWMRDGKIEAILPDPQAAPAWGIATLDAGGLYIAPGWIDAHTHGGQGLDFLECTPGQLDDFLAWLPSTGVTSVLPTLAASPFDLELEVVKRLAQARQRPSPGARIAGLHLEGPFFNLEKRGAQPADAIRPPDLVEMRALLQAAEGSILLVTLAPELAGGLELVRFLVGQGIVVSAGHSNASYEQALAAIQAGISRATHLFNGMSTFNHRSPGLAGAALEQEAVWTELVVDGIHLHPAAVRLAARMKGLQRIILVTDACQAAGMEDGVYLRPGGRKITVRDGAARLDSGTLAGSTLTMDRAVANACAYLGISLAQAVRLAGQNAAESLRLAGKGSLLPGAAADVILIDEQTHVQAAFVGGQLVFSA